MCATFDSSNKPIKAMMDITVNQFRSWNGKNYNGSIYIDGVKIENATKFLTAQKMQKEYYSFLEGIKNYYGDSNLFSQVKNLVEKYCEPLIIAFVNELSENFNDDGGLLARTVQQRIDYIIGNKIMPLESVTVDYIVKSVLGSYMYSE